MVFTTSQGFVGACGPEALRDLYTSTPAYEHALALLDPKRELCGFCFDVFTK
jgi:hypothetical protein